MVKLKTIKKYARPKKNLRSWVQFIYDRVRLWLGLAQWYKQIYPRPRYQTCAVDGCQMKLVGKTKTGAVYWCPKEHRRYHLEGIGGTKLVVDRGKK